MKEYSAEKFKCEYCDSDISLLTKKLQQHPTSQLWLRHGQCCAACKSARETNGINNKELISIQDFDKIFNNNALKPEDHNTNLIHTLTRDSEIEDEAKLNMKPAIFDIVSIFRNNADPKVRHLALVALYRTQDPWAMDFLKRHLEFEGDEQIQKLNLNVIRDYIDSEKLQRAAL